MQRRNSDPLQRNAFTQFYIEKRKELVFKNPEITSPNLVYSMIVQEWQKSPSNPINSPKKI